MNTHLPVFTRRLLATALMSASAAATANSSPEQQALPEVSVTAEFRAVELNDLATSLSVLGEDVIQQRNAVHLEELLSAAPNVNLSNGASRARFFQIRGIGERGQFTEVLRPSVGVLIDGVDFTGVGNAGALLDTQQVEVLRGPQGTLYGANALAGLINIRTVEPDVANSGYIESTVANYGTYQLAGAVGGAISESVQVRISGQHNQSNGYIENDFLNRDDTSNIDEQTYRGKLRWLVNESVTMSIGVLHVDMDNGYDDFSLDNTRTTLSDQPGHDRQEATAVHWKLTLDGMDAVTVETLLSGSDSDAEYGYDEDWSFNGLCTGQPCDGWEYSSTDNYLRDRESASAEIRLVSKDAGRLFNDSTDWVAGIYYQTQDESMHREYTFADADFVYDDEANRTSAYVQFDMALSDQWHLTVGYRIERYQEDYSDNRYTSDTFATDEDLWGGKFSLQYQFNQDNMLYGLVSKGYKTGGVNPNPALPRAQSSFVTEDLLNYEFGYKASLLDDELHLQVAAFYQQRDDIQVSQSITVPQEDDPNATQFIEFTGNAGEGSNYGVETEFRWQASSQLQLRGGLGILRTELDDYAERPELNGRDQAHAPEYQFSLAADLVLTDSINAVVEVEGRDSFFFSDSHNEQSDAYELLHLKVNYQQDNWKVALFGRNLTNEDYQVRGFGGFGNDPRKFYETEPYYQYGQPRVIGVSGRYSF